jgi:hypothetical protein
MNPGNPNFYEHIPKLDRFEDVGDTSLYVPLPEGWHIGVADVENSTSAISAGRYKAVNMVGAAVIAAMMNGLKSRDFPFAFGGDGASIAVPPEAAELAASTLAAVRRFAKESLDLTLRVGIVPVETIRAAGHDVRVARFNASPDVSFAVFAGDGVKWAESALKAGSLEEPRAAPDAWPDLTGLSCRWEPIDARNGRILSLIAERAEQASSSEFAALVTRISEIADAAPDNAVPVSPDKMDPAFPPTGLGIEARSVNGQVAVAFNYIKLIVSSALAWLIFKSHRRFGNFDPEHYKIKSIQNSDFRKFDDGLRMTLDCDASVESTLRRVLEEAHASGVANYGLHVQDAALMTCLVPSVMTDDHMHFIDGAAGGYAQAALSLKQQVAAPAKAA